jgi:iron complex outermembrane receptor protein
LSVRHKLKRGNIMKTHKMKYLSLVIASIVSTTTNVMAEEQSNTQKGEKKEIEVIEVKGIRSSLKEALYLKRNSTQVVDAIVAEDIGQFPDQNVAEALARIPGVNITRNGGEGQKVTIRGLHGGWNLTTINGRKMASETAERNFNYDLIASELVGGVQVLKTPVASGHEGSIGAVVNVDTRKPFDFDGFKFSSSMKADYDPRVEKATPQVSFLVSNTWDDTFGALFTAVVSKKTIRTDRYDGQGFYDPEDPDGLPIHIDIDGNGEYDESIDETHGTVIPAYVRYQNFQDERKRIGASLALQWMPTNYLEFGVDSFYSAYKTEGKQSSISFVTFDESWTPGIPAVSDLGFNEEGLINKMTLTGPAMAEVLNTTTPRDTKAYMIGFTGKWNYSDELTFDMDVSQSNALGAKDGDDRFFVARGFVDDVTIDVSGPNLLPDITMATPLTENSPFGAHYSYTRGVEVEADVKEFRLSGDWQPDHDYIKQVKFGVHYSKQSKYHERKRSRYPSMFSVGGARFESERFDGSGYNPDLSSVEEIGGHSLFRLPQDTLLPADFDNFLSGEPGNHPAPWAGFDFDKLIEFYKSIETNATTNEILPVAWPTDTYKLTEETLAAYAEANIESQMFGLDFNLNLGLRAIETTVTSHGYALNTDKVKVGFEDLEDESGEVTSVFGYANGTSSTDYKEEISFESSYTDVLPTMNFKLKLTDELQYRLNASKVIARNDIDLLRPAGTLSFGNSIENPIPAYVGVDPGLKPLRAIQFDTGLEWYFSDSGLLAASFYYKDMESLGAELDESGSVSIDGHTFKKKVFVSSKYGGSIKGLELIYEQSFEDILPEPFNALGFRANATYIESSYDDPKLEGLPFRNMSKNLYNASVYYEKEDYRAQFSYNWNNKYLVNANEWGGASWRDARGTLDLTAHYDINEAISVSFSAKNLTDTRDYTYVRVPDQARWLDRYGRTYSLTVSYDL